MTPPTRRSTRTSTRTMEQLVEAALFEKYQKYLGFDFEACDTENEAEFENERVHELLMSKICGDWRYGEDGRESW